jgi:1,4-dihydroxy-2-naphthoate octaprenyltransferase
MIKEATSPLEPRYEDLAGDGFGRRVRRLFLATRPKFLTASVLPVMVGTAWGAAVAGGFDFGVALLAVLATALVHAASNVINDVGDEVTGGDRVNEERIFPYTGGSRFIQNRIMTVQEMSRWGQTLLAAAAVLGLVLTLMKGPLVLLLGLAGIAIGVLYSIPAVQLSARGVGEACIAIAFGLLPVCGAAWLQSGLIDWASVLVAIPVGLWVTLILLINEVPDRKADEASGKRTLVVRMGASGARRLYQALHVVAFACVAALVLARYMPWWIAAGGVVILLGGFKASAGIGDVAQGRGALTKSIEMTLGLQVAGSVLLIAGAIFAP